MCRVLIRVAPLVSILNENRRVKNSINKSKDVDAIKCMDNG